MEQAAPLANSSRRDEDIALDLFKVVAATSGAGRTAVGSTGFVTPSASKTDEQVNQLLDLYAKCLRTVQGRGEAR